jgi:hypothetical protein
MGSPKRRGNERYSSRITEFSRPPHEQLEDILIEAGWFGRRRLFAEKFLDLRCRSIVEEHGYEALSESTVEALLPLARGLVGAAIHEFGGFIIETDEALIAFYPRAEDLPYHISKRRPQLYANVPFVEEAS